MLGLGCLSVSNAQFRSIEVDASTVTGAIRSLQAVNGGPLSRLAGHARSISARYKELRIDLVRTHDLYGPTEIDSHFENKFFERLIADPARRSQFVQEANQGHHFPESGCQSRRPQQLQFPGHGPSGSPESARSGRMCTSIVGRIFGGAAGVDAQRL